MTTDDAATEISVLLSESNDDCKVDTLVPSVASVAAMDEIEDAREEMDAVREVKVVVVEVPEDNSESNFPTTVVCFDDRSD